MPLLFNRDVAVTFGTTRVSGLRCAFKIIQNGKPDANPCEISTYNLNKTSRAALQAPSAVPLPLHIEAGYKDALGVLFTGDLRTVTSVRHGPDWITTLRAGDAEHALRTARINESILPGTPIATVIKRVASTLQTAGVDLGDALTQIDAGIFRQGLTEFTNGKVLSGQTRDVLDKLLTANGLEWSIQDKTLQVLQRGLPTNALAIVLSPTTGLIGSPEGGENGKLKITALIQPSLRPGRKVKVESAQINGFYRCETVTHTGDTHGQNWYSELEALPL